MLNIDRFPHLHCDPQLRLGWLCEYYKFGTLADELWREQTYTPELLNYKEGKLKGINLFVPPYLELLQHVMSTHNANYACLFPIPPSVPNHSRQYTITPRSKTGRNRDNRNNIFCQTLTSQNESLLLFDALTRTQKKPPKKHWTANQHRKSTAFDEDITDLTPDAIFVLVDDVYTKGGTLQGAALLLSEKFPQQQIICLPIARTYPADEFVPLFAA
jgi:hypothetical protein